jgi:hypothetical protein
MTASEAHEQLIVEYQILDLLEKLPACPENAQRLTFQLARVGELRQFIDNAEISSLLPHVGA